MPSLTLRGLNVEFPFTPYDCQKDYMDKVIECLQTKVNGVLESPTGTGKTLCLLCATLAWRQYFKDTISARKIAERLGGEEMFTNTPLSSWGTSATDGDTPTYYTEVPKIIYASRTHSQLAQVINELKNTSYNPKMCVLGSREQLCINAEVMRQESNHVKVHMCRGKVSTRSCVYYNNVEEKSTDKDLTNSILDVEDLVKYGTKQRVCPYYLSRSLKNQADIIFMPYNYLLDPKSRRAHNIELNGAVVIFDEAHNVERTCEESTSFDLTPYDVASAITAVDRLLSEQAKEASMGGGFSGDFNAEPFSSGLKIDITTIAKVKQILLDLEAAIDSYEVQSDQGITKPGIFIYELLERAHLTYSSKTAVSEALDQIIGYLTGQTGIFQNTSGLQKLNEIIQLVFCGEPADKDRQLLMQTNTSQFKVHIHRDNSTNKKKQSTDVWASSSSKKQGNILSYWCFSPGFCMQELVSQGVRSIILTSGTLSPLTSFTSEMRIKFPVSLENKHVIERDQIFVSVIEKGPDSVKLSSAFDRRFVPENMASLGNTVANLSRVVPHGLLVFFPSFPVMEKTLDFWKTNGHAARIEKLKPMFVEPKGKGTFNEVIDGYYSKVNDPASKGGSFFAVCRGKASEGLDFADTFGRGVIITGLPFPPRMDPRVVLKMRFLDEMCRKPVPGMKYLSGQEWYRQQAFRAVNQAIGRVIRHKEDFGAIFLCDQRFKNADVRAHLPSWVRPYVRPYESFGNMVRDVSQFFRVAHKLRPVVTKTTTTTTTPAAESRPSLSSPGTSSWTLPSSSLAKKAMMLDTHLPSLKKRKRGDGPSSAYTMAYISEVYDMDMPDTPKKPVSLLAALEQGDHHVDAQNEGIGGEEQANRWSTLSLQHEKRMDDKARGGKRKIKLHQGKKPSVSGKPSEESKADLAKVFLASMKRSLSRMNFDRVMAALQKYKKTDDLDLMLAETSVLTEDVNTHCLLRGFYQFIRPHHKEKFEDACVELTGQGCGYKPEHSLSKDEKKAMMQRCGVASTSGKRPAAAATPELFSQESQENQESLTQLLMGENLTKESVHGEFVDDLTEALGQEDGDCFFRALYKYKKTENYENMVTSVVALLKNRDPNHDLLYRLGSVIRPHHREQYNQMVQRLMNPEPPPRSAESKEQPKAASPQKKKHYGKSFFSLKHQRWNEEEF
ncbi:unnamed protein product [Ophioblennius macclurei]